MGRHLDEFTVGQEFVSPRRTITEADIMAFAGLTGDFNPVHTDALYAAETPFGVRIAHGPMLVGMAYGLLSRLDLVDGTALALLSLEWRFQGPVLPGDTVRVVAEVTEVRPSESKPDRGVLGLTIAIRNQRDETVQTGTTTLLLRCNQA